MNYLDSEDLLELLEEIKIHLHDMNHLFFVNTSFRKSLVNKKVRTIWTLIHQERKEIGFPNEEPYTSLQKIAGQLGRMSNIIRRDEYIQDIIVREFMILRGFVEQYEKNLAAFFYYEKTGSFATKVLSLQEAASLIGKSEVTMRRYVHSGKVLGIRLTRKYWIAIEELIPLLK
jgi:hypothetical protein